MILEHLLNYYKVKEQNENLIIKCGFCKQEIKSISGYKNLNTIKKVLKNHLQIKHIDRLVAEEL